MRSRGGHGVVCVAVAPVVLLGIFVGAARAATVTGTVTWTKARTIAPISVTRDNHVCGHDAPVFGELIAVDARGRVRDVVVVLETAAKPSSGARATRLVIDQQNCMFLPRVAAVRRGSKVAFSNSDPVLHNVFVEDDRGHVLANFAMPVKGQRAPWIDLERAGMIRVRCDAGHEWMRASVVVVAHGWFATTNAEGMFAIPDVPVGRHRVVAWHPDLGRREAEIVVDDLAPKPVVFVYDE